MKVSFLPSFLLAFTLFLFSQCKKDDNPPPPASANYSPLTAGTTWTYVSTETGAATDTFTVNVTDRDFTVNNRSYKILTTSDGSDNIYQAKQDSDYYRFATFGALGSFEELYLKDNRPVNSTWTNSTAFNFVGSPVPLTANLTYTIKEKGITYKVNGKDYNNVIHVNVIVNVFSTDIGGGEFYYADGVGLIENQISVALSSSAYSSKQQLLSYQIK